MGAPYSSEVASNAGSAHGGTDDELGYSVALAGSTVVAGAFYADRSQIAHVGAAYAFTLEPELGDPCAAEAECPSGAFCINGVCCDGLNCGGGGAGGGGGSGGAGGYGNGENGAGGSDSSAGAALMARRSRARPPRAGS